MSLHKSLNIVVYGLSGAGALALGVMTLLGPTGLVPSLASESGDEAQHLAQELGAALVFVGLIAFWCLFNLERSRAVHYLLMTFFALISLVHWLDYARGTRPLMSGLVNTIPVLVLTVVACVNHVHRKRESQLRVGG